MSKMVQLKKRLEKIEEKVAPNPKVDLVVVWSFGSDDEPHGKYGYRKLHIFTGETEPVDEADEIEMLREHYEGLPGHCKKKGHVWESFEKFLKTHECNCGKPHPYTNPEYRQQNKWG